MRPALASRQPASSARADQGTDREPAPWSRKHVESEAMEVFERVLALTNDVALLAEEYDPVLERQLGNFPQAFTHIKLIRTAQALS
ncbi:hypothetical protein GCM10023317_45790 [Actinopolymorpha pittospori]